MRNPYIASAVLRIFIRAGPTDRSEATLPEQVFRQHPVDALGAVDELRDA